MLRDDVPSDGHALTCPLFSLPLECLLVSEVLLCHNTILAWGVKKLVLQDKLI